MSALSPLDLAVVAVYAIGLIALATWISREPRGHERDANDYFLAGRALPWWAVGASLIAANISAEQIIGMSGSGYAMGLAIDQTSRLSYFIGNRYVSALDTNEVTYIRRAD